jgi:hypothetical protein
MVTANSGGDYSSDDSDVHTSRVVPAVINAGLPSAQALNQPAQSQEGQEEVEVVVDTQLSSQSSQPSQSQAAGGRRASQRIAQLAAGGHQPNYTGDGAGQHANGDLIPDSQRSHSQRQQRAAGRAEQ